MWHYSIGCVFSHGGSVLPPKTCAFSAVNTIIHTTEIERGLIEMYSSVSKWLAIIKSPETLWYFETF